MAFNEVLARSILSEKNQCIIITSYREELRVDGSAHGQEHIAHQKALFSCQQTLEYDFGSLLKNHEHLNS